MMENENLFRNKIEKLLENKNTATNLLMSTFGQCGILVEFIKDNHGIEDLPMMVKYAIFMSITQLRSLTSQSELNIKMKDNSDYMMSEQTEERIYRIMDETLDMFIAEREEELKNGK
jgi:hypothetical protein